MSVIRDWTTCFWLAGMVLVLGTGQGAYAQAAGPDERRIELLQAKPRAYAVVEAAGNSPEAQVRLRALEAAEHAPDAAFDLARNGLVDENPAVRFAALVTIGKLRIDRLADAAIDLMRDPNESVRAAALFAAHRCGREVDLSPFGRMLASGDPGTRANAAMLIGQLGDPQAIDMLRDMAGLRMPRVSSEQRAWVRLQFAEAMIRLNPDDPEVLGTIRAAMYSNLDDVRVLAIQVLGEVGDRSVQGALVHIIDRENPIQVKIAAAQALARMGDGQALPTLLEASRYSVNELRQELERYVRTNGGTEGPEAQAVRDLLADEQQLSQLAAEVRAQAAIALGWGDSIRSARRLAELLEDPSASVRVAAASSVLRASR